MEPSELSGRDREVLREIYWIAAQSDWIQSPRAQCDSPPHPPAFRSHAALRRLLAAEDEEFIARRGAHLLRKLRRERRFLYFKYLEELSRAHNEFNARRLRSGLQPVTRVLRDRIEFRWYLAVMGAAGCAHAIHSPQASAVAAWALQRIERMPAFQPLAGFSAA